MAQESEPLVLTVRETARLLSLSLHATYEAVARGDIFSLRVGKRLLIPKARLLRLLNEAGKQKEEAGQCPAR